jgi:hypothetical protein
MRSGRVTRTREYRDRYGWDDEVRIDNDGEERENMENRCRTRGSYGNGGR